MLYYLNILIKYHINILHMPYTTTHRPTSIIIFFYVSITHVAFGVVGKTTPPAIKPVLV